LLVVGFINIHNVDSKARRGKMGHSCSHVKKQTPFQDTMVNSLQPTLDTVAKAVGIRCGNKYGIFRDQENGTDMSKNILRAVCQAQFQAESKWQALRGSKAGWIP
jgi:hypothetical protein